MDFLGILMLDTAFPRIHGDAGNVDSYPFAVKSHVVKGAGSLDIVRHGQPDPALITAFCHAAQQLQADGARAIISTCGFLVQVQDQIAAAVDIPVMVSALSLYPEIRAKHPNGPIGILTASKTSLGISALLAAGIGDDCPPIKGMESCAAFAKAILRPKADQSRRLDQCAIRDHAVSQAQAIIRDHPNTCAILLECGNLPPYAEDIAHATQRPVYSILDAASRLMGMAD